MLNLFNIQNINIDIIKNELFDVGIFASGYETRSSYLAKNLSPENIKHKIIFGFKEHTEIKSRKENDKFYNNSYGYIHIISSQEEKQLYSILLDVFNELKDKANINVLIDYTSMSRLWYSGILNFLRFQKGLEINVFINYSLAVYSHESIYLDYSYSSINSLPSHEGSLSSNNKTLLILSVGFSPYLVKSVIEEIEPNNIIGILPIPNLIKEYEAKSLAIKDNILTKDINNWINCPIYDLESIFRTYSEISNHNMSERDLIFLSLGPKIFNMASILVSQRFEQATCLYLKSSQKLCVDLQPTGNFICNKIKYKP